MDPLTALFYAVFSAMEVGGIGFSSTALAIMSYAAAVATVAAGSYLLNRALAPSIKDRSAGGARWTPQTTENEGLALQECYGLNRCHANIVGSFTVVPSHGVVLPSVAVTRQVKACFGAGPWATEPDPASIRVNGRPITDYAGLTATWRLGTTAQAVLPGWSVHRQDYQISQALLYGSPVTWTLARAGWDDLAVILEFPSGLIAYGTDGGTDSVELDLRVEVGDAIADTWQTLINTRISGKSAQPAYISFLASGTYPGGTAFVLSSAMQPRLRVTRVSPESATTRVISKMEVYAAQVYKNVAFRHPGYVLLGLALVPDEAVSGGLTELSCLSTGKIVADGAGGYATTRYAADVIRDILTQPVVEGDGGTTPYSCTYFRGLAPARLVGAGWAAQKAKSDTAVPDGTGGTDALLRCDVTFGSPTNCHDAIQQVAASGRCGLSWQGRDVGLWTEHTGPVVGILCDGSWERNSAVLSPVPAEDLASAGTATYRDAAANYEDRPVRVVDNTLDTLAQVDLQLAAETRMHGAARLLRRELARNWLLDMTLSCRADLDAAIYEAGDILYCQIDGKSLGGRIVAVSADGKTLTADRDLTDLATGADGVAVQVHDPTTNIQSVEDQTATLTGSRTITVPASWKVSPVVKDVFLFGPATITEDWYEIVEISLDHRLHASIELAKHVTDTLDDLDSYAPDVDVPLGSLTGWSYGGVHRRPLDGDLLDGLILGSTVVYEGAIVTYDSEVVTYG
jgi:hypothetical protein